jgi:hypothetical protein
MNSDAHVLVVSRDQMLLQTRKLILGAFFEVDAAGRVPEAEVLMAKTDIDLIVLCYSLSDDEYSKMIDLANRQDPPPKILTLCSPSYGHSRAGCDQEFIVENGPYALLKKIAEMVGLPIKGSTRVVPV